MGKAHEDLDHLEEAKHFYKLAENTLDVLSDDRYGNLVRLRLRAIRRLCLR
jgi:hypothetical protein